MRSWFAVSPQPDEHALALTVGAEARELTQALVLKVRRMFDLDADLDRIAAHLRSDALLGPLLARHPPLRLPAAFDPFEQAVRATVKAAVTITRRLVERLGETLPDAPADQPQRLFPTPAAIAGADLALIGMPGKRVQTLQRFAAAVAEGALRLHVEDGPEDLVRRLRELPGIGPWTAEYIALRGFGAADAFPAADLGLLKAPLWGESGISARQLQARAETWRPWRAYAALHLWHNYSGA